ncbi:DUF4893 domain-containing protein [uncultured Sphingomonas sp.]|uniref:DUF4893 domain-containing protein n=1 Tax=uncultured Sphingomonas sp. TaxID=158754 RepID=UPI003748C6DF
MRRAAGALLLCLGGCGAREAAPPTSLPPAPAPGSATSTADEGDDWRRQATLPDRNRLRRWRDAWVDGLSAARRVAPSQVAAQGALLAIDAALPGPVPPPGTYRCRMFKLGSKGGVGGGFTAYDWFDCRIAAGAGGTRQFVKLTGSQRQAGVVFEAEQTRAAFLGTLMLGDEARAYAYGVDNARDVAGWVERVEPRRWRLVMPYPTFESTLDVLELVPAR